MRYSVTDAWVINASPLILYARIGRLDLFEQLAPALIVPEKVIEEVQDGVHKDRTAPAAVAWAMQYQYPNLIGVLDIL